MGVVLAIDIGGTTFSLALINELGHILSQTQGQTNRAGGAPWMIEQIIKMGTKLRAHNQEKPSACGIGFGGPVDFEQQKIVRSVHVAGWEGMSLAQILGKELGLSAVVENDANCGALGEFVFGAGRKTQNMVYYTISTGIGGGLIVGGKLYRGAKNQAGELGHVVVDPSGYHPCDCGNNGCLEALGSGKSIGRIVNRRVQVQPQRGRALRAQAGEGALSAKVLFDTARSGDPLAVELVEEICRHLGMGMAATMNSLAPDIIVVGGGVSRAGRVLFEPLRTLTRQFTMPELRPSLKIVPARRGTNSVLLGAARLAMDLDL